MNRKMLAAFAATAAFALPTAAFALDKNIDVIVDGRTATGDESLSVGIKLGDLDLASDQGQRTASARIDHAARTICTWKTGTVIPEREDYRACYSDAIDSARQDIQSFAQAQRQG